MEPHLPLSDEQWAKIEPLINPPESAAIRGRPPIDERLVLDAILWKLSTNKPWYDLPFSQGAVKFPSHQTCYRRYRQWRRTGLLNQILATIFEDLLVRGGFDLQRALHDGTIKYERRGRGLKIFIDPQLRGTWQISTALILLSIAARNARSHLT
jgi:transposase